MNTLPTHLHREIHSQRGVLLFLGSAVVGATFLLAWFKSMDLVRFKEFVSANTNLWGLVTLGLIGTTTALVDLRRDGRTLLTRLPDHLMVSYLAKAVLLVILPVVTLLLAYLASILARTMLLPPPEETLQVENDPLRVVAILLALAGHSLTLFGFTCLVTRFGPALLLGLGYYLVSTEVLRMIDLSPLLLHPMDRGLPGLIGGQILLVVGAGFSYWAYRHRFHRYRAG